MSAQAVIFGFAGLALSEAEIAFFRAAKPWGFILFARNCADPAQLRALCASLRDLTGRAHTTIFIDQEGGRVARLRPPHWRLPPPAAIFGALREVDAERGGKPPTSTAALSRTICLSLGSTPIACRFSTCRIPARTTSSATGPMRSTRTASPNSDARRRTD